MTKQGLCACGSTDVASHEPRAAVCQVGRQENLALLRRWTVATLLSSASQTLMSWLVSRAHQYLLDKPCIGVELFPMHPQRPHAK